MHHQSADSEQQRHRVLAGISRSRLLAVLRQATEPMGVRELADAVNLHPNTAREHLEQLVTAGLVIREAAAPRGRGRPGLRYRAGRNATDEDPRAYRELAAVLAGELARRPNGSAAATAAGERWGRRMASGREPAPTDGQAVEGLVALLDEVGFAPEPVTQSGAPIRLRHCPFATLAHQRRDVVCGVHLGLMRGALSELGAPLDAVSLEAFVEPDLCLAHLATRP